MENNTDKDIYWREDAAKKIHEKARYYRGRFLNSVAVIDHKASMIITKYFCKTNESIQELFFTKIVTAQFFSLRRKKDIAVEIVKILLPDYWERNKEHFKKLEEIIDFRNKLAHSIIDVSDEALRRPVSEGIGFIEWKNGEAITDRTFNDWEVKANMVFGCFSEIERLL